jgi:ribosomal protein S18 acetylase RimI-like enzyme
MKELLIEKMQYSEMDEVAGLLTDSFLTNPAYALIFRKEDQRRDGLFWVFKASLILNNRKRALTYVVKKKDTPGIIGTFTLVPPEGVKNGLSAYLKTGLPGFIAKFGPGPLMRMIGLDNCNKKSLARSIKAPEYYYLSMVVIREDFRGTGIGSHAIEYAIREVISSNSGCKLMGLTTQLPENVSFYSRLGFEKLDEGYIDFKGDRYYNYTMKRCLQDKIFSRG